MNNEAIAAANENPDAQFNQAIIAYGQAMSDQKTADDANVVFGNALSKARTKKEKAAIWYMSALISNKNGMIADAKQSHDKAKLLVPYVPALPPLSK